MACRVFYWPEIALAQIFVSHCSEDQTEYQNLTFSLRRSDIDVWDPAGLLAGSPLSDQLRSAIQNCFACIFLATKRSVQSKWCLAELGAFWGTGKKVVIYLSDRDLTENDLPPQFRGNVLTSSVQDVVQAIEQISAGQKKSDFRPARIPGLRLFQHEGYYPIDLADGNRPVLNAATYIKALHHFLEENVYDRRAAMDLVYLRVDNFGREPDIVPASHERDYSALIRKYELEFFREHFKDEKERVFRNARRVVNDLGQTLKGVFLELVLHDVRNPIHSIIAARNTSGISNRNIGDPSTRFVVNYVRNQGRDLMEAMEGGSKIAYKKTFTQTKVVKATTTPIHDDLYGLVGILCLNIDIEALDRFDEHQRAEFFENFKRNTGKTPAFELL